MHLGRASATCLGISAFVLVVGKLNLRPSWIPAVSVDCVVAVSLFFTIFGPVCFVVLPSSLYCSIVNPVLALMYALLYLLPVGYGSNKKGLRVLCRP